VTSSRRFSENPKHAKLFGKSSLSIFAYRSAQNHTKRKSIMLTTSLVGTKVTAATRVQTVKRNTTVRAATQKVGAKGKKKGEKVRR
jgi:hypothetical protein